MKPSAILQKIKTLWRPKAPPVAPNPPAIRTPASPGGPSLHGFTLQPVTMGIVCLLKQTKSPLLLAAQIMTEEAIRVAGDTGNPKAADEGLARALARIETEIIAGPSELLETVFIFTRPPNETRAILAQGKDALAVVARRELGDVLSVTQFSELRHLIGLHYAQSILQTFPGQSPAA